MGIALSGPIDHPRREVRDAALRRYLATRLAAAVLRKAAPKLGGKAKGVEKLLDILTGTPPAAAPAPAPTPAPAPPPAEPTPQPTPPPAAETQPAPSAPAPHPPPPPTPEIKFENLLKGLLKGAGD